MLSRTQTVAAFAAASQEHTSPSPFSTGEALRRDAPVLRRRAGDGVRNSPLMIRAIRLYRQGLVANPRPIWKGPSKAATRRARMAWEAWARSVGYEHNHGSFTSLLFRVAHELVESGEVFIQRVMVDPVDRHPNGLLLQVWPGRLRDRQRVNFLRRRTLSPRISDGIEYQNGLPTAIWFRGATSAPDEYEGYRNRIPYRDLIWLRNAPYGDQIDGLPLSHASIQSDRRLDRANQLALIQQQVQSAAVGVALSDMPALDGRNLMPGPPRLETTDGETIHEMQAGSILIGHGIKEFRFNDPRQGAYPTQSTEGMIAAGLGLFREVMSGQAGEASYSGLRMAVQMGEQSINEIRQIVDWVQALQQMVDWYREAELQMGRKWSVERYPCTFLPPTPLHLDPEKQAKANKINLETKLKSRHEIISAEGRDPDEVDAEIEADELQVPAGNEEPTNEPARHLQVI